MNASEVEALLQKYYEGETSLEEEQQLRDYFRQTDTPPASLQSYAAQFQYPQQVQKQRAAEVAWEDWLATHHRNQRHRNAVQWWLSFPVGWQFAASITLVLLGFAGGLLYDNDSEKAPVQTAATHAQTQILRVKQVLQFDQMEQTSASERIQVIRQSTDLTKADEELIQVLINTLNFDDNVNVRLAACEALLHFAESPHVREAFILSLRVQTDPAIQIALIDALVTLQEKRALEEMQRLTLDPKVLEIVRLHAQQGLGKLI